MSGQLPVGWDVRRLDEVAEIVMGQSPSSKFYNQSGNGLPFFQGKAEFTDFYPKTKKWSTMSSKIAQKDDVLISVRAPVGPTNFAPSECCIGRGLAAIRPQNGISSKYILYYLRSIEHEVSTLGTGTTFKAISSKILKAIEVPVAPLDQRERIVAEIEKQFSRLDKAIASLKRVKANLKRYKAAVLKAAVEGNLTEEWRKQNPDVEPVSKLLERILAERRAKWEESELAKMKANGKEPRNDEWKEKYKEPQSPESIGSSKTPHRWAVCRTDQLFWFVTSGSRGWAKYYSDRGSIFLRIGNLDHNSINLDLSDIQHVRPPAGSEVVRTRVQENDILISITADVGMIGVIPPDIGNGYINQHISLARPVEAIDSSYLAWFLASKPGQTQFQNLQRGATKAGLGLDDIRAIDVTLPPLKEQGVIVDEVSSRLSVIDKLETEMSSRLQLLDRLRQSVLGMAFGGALMDKDASSATDS